MYRFVERISRLFALAGGAVLILLIVLTCASVLGRSLNSILHSEVAQSAFPAVADMFLELGIGPINGDFEIVEAGMAFAIFAFLPICQLHGAHASVDIFTGRLADRANRILRAMAELAFAGVLILIAVQLYQGMLSKLNSGQTTLLLEFPVWWSYAASVVAACVAAGVGIYVALCHLQGRANGPDHDPGADH